MFKPRVTAGTRETLGTRRSGGCQRLRFGHQSFPAISTTATIPLSPHRHVPSALASAINPVLGCHFPVTVTLLSIPPRYSIPLSCNQSPFLHCGARNLLLYVLHAGSSGSEKNQYHTIYGIPQSPHQTHYTLSLKKVRISNVSRYTNTSSLIFSHSNTLNNPCFLLTFYI